jgi:hypothetical protein
LPAKHGSNSGSKGDDPVARTRAGAGGKGILLKTDLGAGHFSFTDRYVFVYELLPHLQASACSYVYLRVKAFEYAWMMDALGKGV